MDEQRVAIVTGGASGIGLAISERLAADGNAVAVLDLDPDAATAAAGQITGAGASAIGLGVDVSEREQVVAAVDAVRQQLGPIAILVNNAGMSPLYTKFLDITPEVWDRYFGVNSTGAFHCSQAVLPDMVAARWGRIVNISSSSTHGGQPLMSHYVSSKSALNGLTKSLALEFGSRGITVNAIPPGFIDTPMLRASEARGEFGPGGVDDAIRRTPVRRAGLPEDIAAMCSFLCRDEAGYVTGQIIGVNGGRNT
jgi:NAD(P)-dependent dehydrogenase (short-subunit alcohol dehydrogenase family)